MKDIRKFKNSLYIIRYQINKITNENIMLALKEDFSWEIKSWGVLLLFYIITTLFAIQTFITINTIPGTLLLYFIVNTIFIILATVNIFFSHPSFRFGISMFFLVFNTFLIPASINGYLQHIEYSLATALLYTIFAIAVTPKSIAFSILLSSIGFASFTVSQYSFLINSTTDTTKILQLKIVDQEYNKLSEFKVKHENWKFLGDNFKEDLKLSTYSNNSILKIPNEFTISWKTNNKKYQRQVIIKKSEAKKIDTNSLGDFKGKDKSFFYNSSILPEHMKMVAYFISAAIIAFMWKLLIHKMTTLYNSAGAAIETKLNKKLQNLKSDIESQESDQQMLKEEIALQILEMNKATNYVEPEEDSD